MVAEKAVLTGQINSAKILRAAAHSQRFIVMNARVHSSLIERLRHLARRAELMPGKLNCSWTVQTKP